MFDFILYKTDEDNVSYEYISELENKLGIVFPDVLKEYYTQYNTATIKEISFQIHNLSFAIEFIIPLVHGNVCVEKILSFNETNEYIEESFIPLAEDIDGEDFYWDSKTGNVYYLSMGNVENPIPICDSVEDFFIILNESC